MGAEGTQVGRVRLLSQHSHDAARRHASKAVLTAIFSRQSVSVGASRAAGYATLVVAGLRAPHLATFGHPSSGLRPQTHRVHGVRYDEVEWQVGVCDAGPFTHLRKHVVYDAIQVEPRRCS
jgi:hypothetical protein